MPLSKIDSDSLNSGAVTSTALASGVPTRAQLPAGSVLQVVQSNTSSSVNTTSASYVTTGLTATITPTFSTSTILVCVNMLVYNTTAGGQSVLTVFRGTVDGTDLGSSNGNGFGGCLSGGGEVFSVVSGMIIDSPATTSATTYTVGLKRKTTGTAYSLVDNQKASITLMEIAA